jgi:hypothetical protein
VSNEWKDTIIEQLVIPHIYKKEHEDNPTKAINDLICFHVSLSLDPLVSKDARELIKNGYQLSLVGKPLPFEQSQENEGDF